MADDVKVSLGLDTSPFSKALGEATQQIKDFAGGIGEKALSKLSSNFSKVALTALTVAAAVKTLQKGFDLSLQAEQLDQINKTFDVLAKQAGANGANLKEAFLAASGGITGAEEVLRSANKALIELGGSAQKLPDLFNLARQSSKVFGGEAVENFDLITRAISSGNARSLKQIGIFLDSKKVIDDYAKSIGVTSDLLSQQGKQQAVLNAVLDKGKQQYQNLQLTQESLGNSFNRLKTASQNFFEGIGAVLLSTFGPALKAAFSGLSDFLNLIGTALSNRFANTTEAAQFRVNKLTTEILSLEKSFRRAQESGRFEFADAIRTKVEALRVSLSEARGELEGLANAANVGQQAPGGQIDPNVRLQKEQGFNKLLLDEQIKASNLRFQQAQESGLSEGALHQINQERFALIDQQAADRRKQIELDFSTGVIATKEQRSALELALEQQTEAQKATFEDQANKTRLDRIKSFNAAFNSSLSSGISKGIQGFVGALAKGEDGFAAFGSAIFGILGDLAVNMGTTILTSGIAMQSLGDLTGTSAIIAGAALIAVGTLIKAFASGGSKDSGVSTAGAGGAPGGTFASSPTFAQEEERREPQTAITVVVQGNLLDRRETGLAIAEVINETFGTNGVIIARSAV